MPRLPILRFLLTNAQLGDAGTVAVDVLLGQVVKEVAALADHHQKATTGVVVVLVHPQMLGELVDAGGEDGNLHLGRAGVALVGGVGGDDSGLVFFADHDNSTFQNISRVSK